MNKICNNLLYLSDIGSNHKFGNRELSGQNNLRGVYHTREGIYNLLEHRNEVYLLLYKTLGLGLNLRHADKSIDYTKQLMVILLYLGYYLISVFIIINYRQQISKANDSI